MSMFDPIYLGVDEFGNPVYVLLVYKNLLSGGEPGAGKSTLLNAIAAHAVLSNDARLVLFDGKWVEMGMWEDCADAFVGSDIAKSILTLRRFKKVINNRYAWLKSRRRKKVTKADRLNLIVGIIDELAYYSATVGAKQQQDEFVSLCVMWWPVVGHAVWSLLLRRSARM